MKLERDHLTEKKILLFWIPLAATWLMMSAEGPLITAIIARLGQAKYNLAAFGLTFSFVLIIESPVVMILSAATALVKNQQSYIKLRNFLFYLLIIIGLLFLLFLFPPIFKIITKNIFSLPDEIIYITYKTSLIMFPFPLAVGYRRFNHGILIRNNKTKYVALGTIIRLTTIVIVLFILFFFYELKGAFVGAIALTTGVILEAIASRIMVIKILRKYREESEINVVKKLEYKEIIRFYYPLILTSYLILGIMPFVNYFVSKSPLPIESLAVLPVVNSFVFIFRSLGLSYQEVGIALLGDKNQNFKVLRKFVQKLAYITSLSLAVVVFTPIIYFWYKFITGLSDELIDFALFPTSIFVLMPALTAIFFWQTSVLIKHKKTFNISVSTAIELCVIVLCFIVNIYIFKTVGIVSAAIAIVVAKIFSNIYIHFEYSKLKKIC